MFVPDARSPEAGVRDCSCWGMNLLLLSINLGAVPHFLDECVGDISSPLCIAYITDAAEGMPFAGAELD